MKYIDTILFDLDGTLTDPKPGITGSIAFALNKIGYEAPSSDSLHWCIGPPLKESFSKLLSSSDSDLLDEALNHYRSRFSEIGLYENSVYHGVPEMLETISGLGIRIILATSKPKIFASRILEHFSLDRFFSSVHGSQLDGTRSNKDELIRYIVSEERVCRTSTMMIGDRKHDILGASLNHISTAAVTYGYGDIDELQRCQPDMFFDSPDEISQFFDTNTTEQGAAANP